MFQFPTSVCGASHHEAATPPLNPRTFLSQTSQTVPHDRPSPIRQNLHVRADKARTATHREPHSRPRRRSHDSRPRRCPQHVENLSRTPTPHPGPLPNARSRCRLDQCRRQPAATSPRPTIPPPVSPTSAAGVINSRPYHTYTVIRRLKRASV